MALEGTYAPDTLIGGFQQDIVSEGATLKVGLSLARGTLVAEEDIGAAAAAADGGNTGNGTSSAVTLQSGAQVGAYVLTCIVDGFTGVGAAGGGNTGNGTMGAVTEGASIEAGLYELICTALTEAFAAVGAPGGGNTGNGTMGAVTDGAAVKVGAYELICTALTEAFAAVAAAGGGNTGDGTMSAVTDGAAVKAGAYELVCTALTEAFAAVGAAGGGNTGNGTMSAVTDGAAVKAGAYELVCTALTEAFAGVGAAGGGNTGNGTMGAVTDGAAVKAGLYELVCLSVTQAFAAVASAVTGTGNGTIGAVTDWGDVEPGVYPLECLAVTETMTAPATGTAAGGNTGNGTCTGVDVGTESIEGTYTLRCIELTLGGVLRFEVTDPNGDAMLECQPALGAYAELPLEFTLTEGGTAWALLDEFTILVTRGRSLGTFSVHTPSGAQLEDATVAVAYLNEHLGFTIADGGTGFEIGDTFDITVTQTDSLGIFSVSDPDGEAMDEATVGAAYANTHIGFTIADGGTAFAVGDTFTVTVTQTDSLGLFSVVDPDGEDMEDATVGAAYLNNHIGFTITDGGTPFIVGDTWTITVTQTDSLGTFSVHDPDGYELEQATVAAAYLNNHIGFTITDGGTPFIVGDTWTITVTQTDSLGTFSVSDPDGEAMDEATVGAAYLNTHIGFTITDGATAFIEGDTFTVTVTQTDSLGTFSVTTPSGESLSDATVGAAYTSLHVGFTITDGGTAFIEGDTFTITVTATATGDTFSVVDPDANNIGNLAAGVAYATEIGLTLTAGVTPWAVGDFWTVTVAAGSGHLIAALSTLNNGGEDLWGILAEDTDATDAALPTAAYRAGQFNITDLTFAGSDDETTWASQGDALNIYFRTNTAAL